MSTKEDNAIFNKLVERAENINKNLPIKRFYPIHSREGNFMTYGMYDYHTKKYVLSKPFCALDNTFEEIESMLNNA